MDGQLPPFPKAFAYATECINPEIGIPHSVSLFWSDQFTGKKEPIDRGHHGIEYLRELVTMEQLHAYAADAVRIERERILRIVEEHRLNADKAPYKNYEDTHTTQKSPSSQKATGGKAGFEPAGDNCEKMTTELAALRQ